MLFAKQFTNKVSNYRKQNWSAPSKMIIFIFLSMLVVFSFESMGLFRRERNLDSRTLYFDNGKK